MSRQHTVVSRQSDNRSTVSELRSPNSGFTLIEAVVSASVFAIAVSAIVGVYVAVQRLNSESIALNTIQQNGRFVMEDLTKIIRNGQIDYASYGGAIPQPSSSSLYLIDSEGQQVQIYTQNNVLKLSKPSIATSDLTGPGVKVLDFAAYIWPSLDPYSGGPSDQKPTVTVFLRLQSQLTPRDTVVIPFQTTIATRQYPE